MDINKHKTTYISAYLRKVVSLGLSKKVQTGVSIADKFISQLLTTVLIGDSA